MNGTSPKSGAMAGAVAGTAMMVLGAFAARALPAAGRLNSVIRGTALGLLVWFLVQYGVLNFLDPVAFDGLIPMAFAAGHIVFGSMLGFMKGTLREVGHLGRPRRV